MTTHMRRLVIMTLPLVISTAQPAAAGLVINAKSIVCGGSGPLEGSITVKEKDTVLTLKYKGKGILPGQAVVCGYFCQAVFSNEHSTGCGTVDEKGKVSAKIELPQINCFGFIPFFRTGTTGSCVPAIPPP